MENKVARRSRLLSEIYLGWYTGSLIRERLRKGNETIPAIRVIKDTRHRPRRIAPRRVYIGEFPAWQWIPLGVMRANEIPCLEALGPMWRIDGGSLKHKFLEQVGKATIRS